MTAPTSLRGEFDPWATTSAVMYDALETIPELQPGLIAVNTYSSMRRDSRLAAIVAAYTLQLRRASWQVEPGGCRPEVVQQVADDLGLPIAGDDTAGPARMRGVSWNDHLRTALLSLVFGHATFELLAEVEGGRARLIALAERMPWTLSMIHADPKSGALLGVTQDATGKFDTPQIKADRLAHYTHERENTWYGNSLLRSSYAPWYLKRELLRIHSTSARRFGMGVPTVEWANGSNPTPAQISEAQRFASAARVGDQSGASLPPGASLVLRGLSGSTPDVLAYIKFLNTEMATAALMQHIDLGNTESGSRATASVFIESWMMALGAISGEISDTATRQIAARIVGWNWSDEPVPRIVCSGIGAQREVTAESLQMLMQAGALTAEPNLEAWVRKEYRLPEAAPLPVAVPGVTLPGQTAPATLPDGSMAPTPATANSTDAGLVTAALTAATSRNWGALDEVAAQMQAREAAAPASDTDLPPHWAAVADDEGSDWKIDAAMARGADVASAFASIYPGGDDQATARGFDIWSADRQIAGDATPATLDEFKAQVTAAQPPALTLDMDNRIVALAVRLGRFAALFAQPITACPYTGPDAEQTALRRVWLSSYLRIRPPATTAPAATPAPVDDAAKTKAPASVPAPAAAPAKATKVVAAAGHPGACAHATLGSVCHCACGGVRHSWLGGDIPSGVNTPQVNAPSSQGGTDARQPNLPDTSGIKVPQGGLPGVNGNKVPQVNPALDGLSGEKPPVSESTPPNGPGSAPDETTPDAASFDDRVNGALAGAEARRSAPVSYVSGIADLTEEQEGALRRYRGGGYEPINALLRTGDPASLRDLYVEEAPVRGWINGLDSAMDSSPLPSDAISYRGLANADRLFGDAIDGDLTGLEWREDAFVSTSTDAEEAGRFARNYADTGSRGSVSMRLLVPGGTGAVELSDESFESELLLERNLRMRVVVDRGVDATGVRQIDVEVLPGGDRPENVHSGQEAKEDGPADWVDVGEGTAGGELPAADPAPAEGRPDPGVDRPAPAEGLTGTPDTRSYDERVGEALEGNEARQSAPLSRVREGDRALNDAELGVLTEYAGTGFLPMNHLLRGGDPSGLSAWDHGRDTPLTEDMVNSWTGAIDDLMSESRLGSDVITWRGMRNGEVLFGSAFGDDLEGIEWREDAFTSTSTDPEVVNDFAADELGAYHPGATIMHILVPPGTGALEISDGSYESELLLQRGLRYRVVYDGGVNPDGVRVLDVEVVRDGAPVAAGTATLQLELPIAASVGYDAARIAAELASAVTGFVGSWPALARPLVSGLVADVSAALSGGGVGRLATLAAGTGAVTALGTALGGAMRRLAGRAARRAAAEVQDLGVNASAGTADRGALQGQADVTAHLVGQALSMAASRTALLHAGGKDVEDAVRAELDELVKLKSGGNILSNLESALAAAQGAGRMATFAQVEDQVSLMAREKTDGACSVCDAINGRVFPSFAAAAKAYPQGRHVGCLGRSNCRGGLQPVRRLR